MTDPIRIPVFVSDGNFRWHCHAEVSADLARQIVAMAQDAGWPLADPTIQKEIQRQVNERVQQDAKPCAHPHAKVLLAPGPVVRWCPDCQQNLPMQDAKPDADPCQILSVSSRVCERGTKSCVTVHLDKPDADEAAVKAMAEIVKLECNERWKTPKHEAEYIIKKIRAGKVPGIMTVETAANQASIPLAQKDDQIAALRRENEALKSDMEAAAGELRVSVRDCAPGTICGQLLSANVILRHKSGDLLSRAVDAEADRDKALAELAAMMERAEKAEALQRLTQKAREDDRGMLQQKCSDWGTYWRAEDSHGVKLNIAQSVELLADALGVEVEIDSARADADALAEALRAMIGLWRHRIDHMPRGGYHEASAANTAEVDTLERCVEDITAALASHDARKKANPTDQLAGASPAQLRPVVGRQSEDA